MFVASLAGLEKPYLVRNASSPLVNASSNSGTATKIVTQTAK
jgi:hypothetical protein